MPTIKINKLYVPDDPIEIELPQTDRKQDSPLESAPSPVGVTIGEINLPFLTRSKSAPAILTVKEPEVR